MRKLRRREFVKGVSAAALAVPLAGLNTIEELHPSESRESISNRYFFIGTWNKGERIIVKRGDGTVLSGGIIQAVVTGKDKIYLNNKTTGVRYKKGYFKDNAGSGEKISIYSESRSHGISSETSYYIYDNLNCLATETIITNISKDGVIIKSIEPLVFSEAFSGSLNFKNCKKVLTNGAMYYDSGKVHETGTVFEAPDPYGPVKDSGIVPDYGLRSDEIISSWWNIAFFGEYDSEALALGFASNPSSFGRVYLTNSHGAPRTLVATASFSEGITLQPRSVASSSKVILAIGSTPYQALELYGSLLKKINNIGALAPINGWCSWFYTYEFVSEAEVLRNAEFVSSNLKDYGLDYIQIDEGYQKYHGDWEANDRFPSGLLSLADKIRALGLKPGIWVAPFVVSEPTQLFREHSDWLLKNHDGSLMRVGPWPAVDTDWAKNEAVRRYGLDISHPGAQEWLFSLFRKLSYDYGFEMFKIDFVAWSVLSGVSFYDNTYSPAKAYRKGIEIIREAVGQGKHINECGPGFITAGLIDSMRIEIDQNYGFSDAAWKQYFTDSSSSAPAAAKRYYFHNNLWINDADHICINSLTPGQAMSVASLLCLTGGNIISGDRLFDLDISKLEILKKALPSYGIAARPSDLLETDRHSVFALQISKPFGNWIVAGLFNKSTDKTERKHIAAERLFAIKGKTYIAFDFWNGNISGEINDILDIEIQPGGCRLLSIHEKKSSPFVISTDRHILQGAIETVDVKWDPEKLVLSGINEGIKGSSYNVFVWFPDGTEWKQDKRSTYSDKEEYSIKIAGKNLVKMRIYFTADTQVKWEIPFGSNGIV